MRSLVLLALTLFAVGTLATDAAAFGKRKNRGGCSTPPPSCCNSYSGQSGYGPTHYGYPGYGPPAGYGYGQQYSSPGVTSYPTAMPIR